MEIIKLAIDELTPDPTNAKDHPRWQIEQIKDSIEQFGNLDPIGVWGDGNLIVEGHGRYEALKELGYNEAECIRLDWLTEEERRAYALVHNKLTMNSGFIPEALDLNLDAVGEIDMGMFGFDGLNEWFRSGDKGEPEGGEEEYAEFAGKFKAKHTTDDCYTPEKVYETVANWVAKEYGLNRKNFVRPFYPGGDYQKEEYKESDVVVDNPPFSILAEIIRWYNEREIKYFLFAPALTAYSTISSFSSVVNVGVNIVYLNKANVPTSFITNLESHEIRARTAPDLYQAVTAAVTGIAPKTARELPKYEYPDEVLTAAMMNKYSKCGIDLTIGRDESEKIGALDAQKEKGKQIFGNGYLLSEKAAAEKAAAEKAAAEKAAAEKWQLSDREKAIVARLSKNGR